MSERDSSKVVVSIQQGRRRANAQALSRAKKEIQSTISCYIDALLRDPNVSSVRINWATTDQRCGGAEFYYDKGLQRFMPGVRERNRGD